MESLAYRHLCFIGSSLRLPRQTCGVAIHSSALHWAALGFMEKMLFIQTYKNLANSRQLFSRKHIQHSPSANAAG
jgi:hypothetical protein